jgi:hypothetical protein
VAFQKNHRRLVCMDRANAAAIAVAHGLSMGRPPGVLLAEQGVEAWNAGVLMAAAEPHHGHWPVDDGPLLDALAHPATTDTVRAHALLARAVTRTQQGEHPQTAAAVGVEGMVARHVDFTSEETAQAWLTLGQANSRMARERPDDLPLAWEQIDVADHQLAALEARLGPAPTLRAWACSSDCALPKTLLAFRRGQVRIEAARARDARALAADLPPPL